MIKKVIIPLAVVLLAVAGILLARNYIFRPASTSVEDEKTDISLEAATLLRAFEENETRANAEYLDKVVAITGIIGEIYQDEQYTTLTLKEPGAFSGISCTFENSSLEDTDFSIGEEIRVRGLCTGYLMDVVLIKCVLIE